MNRSKFFLAALWMSVSSLAYGADTPAPANEAQRYLEALQLKLDHAARRANQPGTGASNVVGLRGSKQEPLSKQLYWKGKAEETPVSPEEVREFRAAVEQARGGQTTEAVAALKTFIEKHPKSPLKPDVEETLRVLSSAAGVSAPPDVPAALS